MSQILIYGANGYSGRLAALHAKEQGLDAIVAGRNPESVAAIAQETGYPSRVFSLDDPAHVQKMLEGVRVVLNCAGPFAYTAEKMIRACIASDAHYLDITGEIAVIELAASFDAAAKEKGLTLMPATGFDVVPTDCMAAHLKEQMPDATSLKLAFYGLSSLSHGTAQTTLEGLGKTGAARIHGAIVEEHVAEHVMNVPFSDKHRTAISIPWGDVSSAYYTTGIPNIRVFTCVPPNAARLAHSTRKLQWLGGFAPVKALAKRVVSARVRGPDEQARQTGWSRIWGEVENAKGERRSANLRTLEAYKLTYLTSVDFAARAQRNELPAGFQTPAGAQGWQYILQFGDSHFE